MVIGAVALIGVVIGVLVILGMFKRTPFEPVLTAEDCQSAGVPAGACAGVHGNADWTPVVQELGGAEMALAPAGCFMMGSEDSEDNERPVHEVCFDEPFWIDAYEVTNAQFAEFLNEVGDQIEVGDWMWLAADDGDVQILESGGTWTPRGGHVSHPVVEVTWFGAVAYCGWRGARLPTEAEWEYAARGPDGLVYPWGDTFDADNVVYDGNSRGLREVGSRPGGISWVGALDMSGNVWEWVNDWYDSGYYADSPIQNPQGPEGGFARMVRGGSWDGSGDDVCATDRDWSIPSITDASRGFRCARSWQAPEPTPVDTPTPATPLPPGFEPVGHNDDWTPVVEEFDGVEMVLVPVGCFMMGDEHYYGIDNDDERPVNQQCFEYPFWIDRYEVTNAQYGAEGAFAGDTRPRDSVSWFDAAAHCASRGARLPTEAEWEYAARGPDGLKYPWGTTIFSARAVYENWEHGTEDVGSKLEGASWVGAMDMSGNVAEWVNSIYRPYPYNPFDGREVDKAGDDTNKRVTRGGSWGSDGADFIRGAYRDPQLPSVRYNTIGLRCARSWEEPEPTPVDTPTPTTPLPPGFEPVGHNDDWTPVIEEFGGVKMALVPTGCFMMGSEDGRSNEQPVREVCFDEPFWIDVYEATNIEFGSAGCEDTSSGDNQPRNCVNWFDAVAHCENRDTHLPTEAEWEYAARGPDGWVYPWGNEFVPDNAVYGENSDGQTWEVGSKPGGVSWVGALDMSGNVWEWVSTWYALYPYDLADDREARDNPGGYEGRVLRGGSWLNNSYALRDAYRDWDDPGDQGSWNGFRCARSY